MDALIDVYARRVRSASRGAAPADRLAHGAHPNLADALRPVLRDAWLEAAWVGRVSAREQVRTGKDTTALWGGWTPGHPRAAERLLGPARDGTGLKALLTDDSILAGIEDTRVAELGRILGHAAATGQSVDATAREITALTGDAEWAAMVAHTELNRAMSTATLDTYHDLGVERARWSVADGNACPVCEDNDGTAVPLDGAFPSGDVAPPAHPRCGCVLTPVVDMTPYQEDGVKAAMPDKGAVAHALDLLDAIPDDPDRPGKIRAPWPRRKRFDVPPEGRWTDAKIKTVTIADLVSTTKHLDRKNLAQHIRDYGQPDTPETVFPQVVKTNDGDRAIYEGHHRLAALWLLGVDKTAVWQVREDDLAQVTVPIKEN